MPDFQFQEASSQVIIAKHWTELEPEDWPWENFAPHEMACRGNGSLMVSVMFMDSLQHLRHRLDKPMHLTSAYRSAKHNDRIGGHPRSFHMGRGDSGTLAVDVAASDGIYRGDLFHAAWSLGWSVGWNAKRGFLHLDRRVDIGWRKTTFDY